MPKIHLAWFGTSGPASWNYPANAIYDWRGAEIYQDVAKLCERAKFDMIFFADTQAIPSVYQNSTDYYVKHGYMINHDPVPALAIMAAATKRIGLVTTMSTTFYPPFLLARLAATMDSLSNGRFGWNVVTSSSRAEAYNFGLPDLPEHDERYEMADEYLKLCRALWRSWDPDALVMDREKDIFADPAKVHAVDFAGKYYASKGPLNVIPSPQHEPVIIMAGASPRGQRFAVENAEVAIAHMNNVGAMRAYSDKMRTQLSDAGRDPKTCKIFFSIKPIIGETESIAKELWEEHYRTSPMEEGLANLSKTLGFDMSQFDLDKPLPKDDLSNKVVGVQSKLAKLTAGDNPPTLREIAKHEGMHETFPICGRPEQVADILEQTAKDGGADGFHFRHFIQDYDYLLNIATKLVPVLQKRGLVRTEYTGSMLRDHLNEF